MNHFREVYRSARGSTVHNIDQDVDKELENHIEIMNITSVNLNANNSIITANLKTASNKVIITVPYRVDTGRDGNIVPLYMQKYFLGQQKAIGGNKKYKYQTKTYN